MSMCLQSVVNELIMKKGYSSVNTPVTVAMNTDIQNKPSRVADWALKAVGGGGGGGSPTSKKKHHNDYNQVHLKLNQCIYIHYNYKLKNKDKFYHGFFLKLLISYNFRILQHLKLSSVLVMMICDLSAIIDWYNDLFLICLSIYNEFCY